jgi:hypothetical protein
VTTEAGVLAGHDEVADAAAAQVVEQVVLRDADEQFTG